jgi:hypothetical protein
VSLLSTAVMKACMEVTTFEEDVERIGTARLRTKGKPVALWDTETD